MKNGGAGLGELFGFAVLAATPACNEKVQVATIWDAGIDAMPMTACGALDGGMVGCPDGSFCSYESCGTTGTCDTIPPEDSCADAGYFPECTCNGVTYFNRCLRLAKKASSSDSCYDPRHQKPCSLNDTSIPCDPGESCLPLSINLSSVPLLDAGLTRELCASFKAPQFGYGNCWVLPKNCSQSGTRLRPCGSDNCVDTCDVLKNGGGYFSCTP